jgi:hypothetical protein
MDEIVRTVVFVSLFGGTSVVLLMILPQIVIRCLQIIEGIQRLRAERRSLFARPPARFSQPGEPPRAPAS